SCCIDKDFRRVGLPVPRPLYEEEHLGSPSPALWADVLPASTWRVELAPQARARARSGPSAPAPDLSPIPLSAWWSGRSRQSGSRVSPDRALGPDGVAR